MGMEPGALYHRAQSLALFIFSDRNQAAQASFKLDLPVSASPVARLIGVYAAHNSPNLTDQILLVKQSISEKFHIS